MRLSSVAQTHPGKKRAHNEDYVLLDERLGLYLICDGVGGEKAGEVASLTSAETIRTYLQANQAVLQAFVADPSTANLGRAQSAVRKAIEAACAQVYMVSERDPEKKGMGTTVALVLVCGQTAIVAHVGDSRVYLLRDQRVHQLTEDHSLVAEQLRKGLITPEQAAKSEHAHVITRAIGTQPIVEVDLLHFQVLPGDLFLVCSDGLCDYFATGREFLEVAGRAPFEKLADGLIDWANQQGGRDNVSALVLKVESGAVTAQATAQNQDVARRIEILRSIPLFRHLSYAELLKVAGIFHEKRFAPGDSVIAEGSIGQEMFVILGGSVKVTKRGQPIAQLKEGDFFGEMALIDNDQRSATITAAEPLKLFVIPRTELFRMLKSDPGLTSKMFWEFCQVLNTRLRQTNELFVGRKSADNEPTLTDFPFVSGKGM